MSKKKTQKEFVKEVFEKVGNEYTVLGEYKGSKNKILIKHNKCGYEYEVNPSNFIWGKRCPKCAGRIKMDQREFTERIFNLVKNEYSVVGKYLNPNTKVKIKHNECGHIFEMLPYSFLQGQRCPNCRYKRFAKTKTKTHEHFLKEVKQLVGNEYDVLGKYIDAKTKIRFRHNKCGHEFEMAPHTFLMGNRCAKCSGNMKKNTELFKKEIYNLVEEEYTVLSEYKHNKYKVRFRHNECDNEFYMTPHCFLRGHRCPTCKESHGEKSINRYLRKNHIKFRSQYRIKECRYKHPLPFDFSLFNKEKLLALLEYDGQQHEKVVEHFGGIEGFKERQRNDKIKNDYCLAKNIPLIRIPYNVEDIETYLDNELSKLNKPIQLALI